MGTVTKNLATTNTTVNGIDTDVTALQPLTTVTKTATCTAQGGGAGKVIDLFTLTGSCHIEELYGEVTEATDSTTLNNMLVQVYSASTDLDTITATGTDYSGCGVGDMFIRTDSSSTALSHLKISTSNLVIDGSTTSYFGCWIAKQSGSATTIQVKYTSDAATDVDIKWTIRYRPVSTDGAIAAA